MELVNVFTLYVIEFTYIRYQNMSCLDGRNIYTMNAPENYVECDKWCLRNNTCGDYTAVMHESGNKCYFKNKSCKKNLIQANELWSTYIKQGN